jgi:drug/metabolite transporter (DMT)-like permease
MRLEPCPATSSPASASGEAALAAARAAAARRARHGLWLGALGVLIFAFSIPMTRLASGSAAAPQLDPFFVALGRAAVAGVLSVGYLVAVRAPWPSRRQWPGLAVTAAGVVFGWPIFLGLAVRQVEAVHAAVVSGLLPLATAAVGALVLRQRPSRGFWGFALAGAGLVVAFAAWRGAGRPQAGDALLLGAVVSAAVGYVAGARLTAGVDRVAARSGVRPGSESGARPMTPEQVISWVLVLALPATLPVLVALWPATPVRPGAWVGFGYVALFSMWIGFFAWYRGLAWGGTLRVSQVQLLQPFLSLLLAVPVLGERLDPATLAFSLAVMACVFLGRRMPVAPSHPLPATPARVSTPPPPEAVAVAAHDASALLPTNLPEGSR